MSLNETQKQSIQSRRKVTPFVIFAVVFCLIFLAFGIIVTARSFEIKQYVLTAIGLFICCLGFLPLIAYLRKTPSIYIDKNKITFAGKETYYWEDMVSISLDVTVWLPVHKIYEALEVADLTSVYIAESTPRKAVVLCFKNDRNKCIIVNNYANTWEMKLFIWQVVVNNGEYAPYTIHNVKNKHLQKEHFVFIKGVQLRCFRGIFLWVCNICGILLILFALLQGEMAIAIVVFTLLYWLFYAISSGLNYFGISENYVVVRKHNLPWRKKIFFKSDIREIVFDNNSNLYPCVNVVTVNFKIYSYRAPTIPFKKWFVLKKEFEKCNITVKNVSINEYYRED